MNYSIQSLSILSFQKSSPFFQLLSSFSKNKYVFFSSSFSNSISSIISSSSKNTNFDLQVKSTKFFKILKTSIKIQRMSYSSQLFGPDSNLLKITSTSDGKYDITNCNFVKCHSDSSGGSISITNQKAEIFLTNCNFVNSSANGRAGAVEIIASLFTNICNCFIDCFQGKDNGYDGSAEFTRCFNSTTSQYISTLRCPGPSRPPSWYGVLIFGYGLLRSEHINCTDCNLQFVSGLAHYEPNINKSFIKYYIGFRDIQGNPLTFMNLEFPGIHSYGAIINCSSNSGLVYVQNATTTIYNFVFARNKGKLTYMCVGGLLSYITCSFDNRLLDDEKGNGFGSTLNCFKNQIGIKIPIYEMLNTHLCPGYSPNLNLFKKVISKTEPENKLNFELTIFSPIDIIIPVIIVIVVIFFFKLIKRMKKDQFKKDQDKIPLLI